MKFYRRFSFRNQRETFQENGKKNDRIETI